MADPCVIELAEKKQLSQFETEMLADLEREIHRLKEVHGSDTKSLNEEFKEVMEKFKVDSKYHSARIIEDNIKAERMVRNIIDVDDFDGSEQKLIDFFEGNNSVESTYRTYATKYTNQFRSELKRSNLEREFFSGEYDKLIYEEAYRRANNLDSVADPKARQIYGIIKKLNNQIYNDLKVAGLNVRYRRDFLVSRNYDSARLLGLAPDRNQARDIFVQTMKEKYVDMERTFSASTMKKLSETGDASDVDNILSQMFDDIVAAQRVHSIDDMQGKKTYLNRLKSRKIEFKNGEAEFEFNKEFGNGRGLGESIEYQVDRNAKTVANVSSMGTKPEAAWAKAKADFEKAFEGKVEKDKVTKAISKAQSAYLEVVAPPHRPTTAVKKTINMLRGLSAFSKLGSSILAAAYDINSSALQYAVRTGEFQFNGYIQAFVEGAKAAYSPAQLKELGEALNVNTWFNDSAIVLGGHRGDYDTGFDKINRFFTHASKFTGVPYQTEVSRVVNGVLQSRAFQKMVDGLDNLNNLQKIAMEEYGITVDDLKFLRDNGIKNKEVGAMTSYDILQIPLEKFDADRGKALRMREKLFQKHANYIDDAVQKGTPTPTAKVKRQLGKGRDNPYNDVASLVMQFKETAWKILLANKEALNKYYQAQGAMGATMAVSEYMALGMVSYMAIETTRAKLFNQPTPYDRLRRGEDLRGLFTDFVNKSSAIPVLSDAIDQGTSPYFGNSFSRYVAGPNLAVIDDAFGIARAKDSKKAGKRFLKRHVLPSNWIPLKAANRHFSQYDWFTGERLRK